jgi:hypothetical protein
MATRDEVIEEERPIGQANEPQSSPRSDEEFGLPAAVGVGTGQIDPTVQSTTASGPKSEYDGTGYFGPRQKRIVAFCFLLLWICVFVFPRWSEYNKEKSSGQDWVNAYKLHFGGAIIIFVGMILVLVAVSLESRVNCCQNRLLKVVVTGVVLLGAFLYWVGGIELAKSINDIGRHQDKSHKYHLSGWAGTVFIEATFIALTAITVGIDYLTNFLSKSERVRIFLVLNTVLGFTALVAFFSYAAWRGYGMNGVKMSRTACVSAGWFFVLVSCIYWYAVEFADICCKCSATAQACVRDRQNSIRLAGVIILLFGGFIVMVGMWSIGTLSDKKWNCYYVGYGFFVFFFCCLVSLDVHLGRVLEERSARK